jgi:hypothetical protein
MNEPRDVATIGAAMTHRGSSLAARTASALSLVVLALLGACDTYSSIDGTDAGTTPLDAGSVPADAPSSDAPRVALDIGPSCATDADCEDGDPDTHAYCHAVFRVCIDTECTTDAHCDDHDPCTLDYCLSMSSCGHGSDNCCTTDADCADGNECTNDVCGADSTCDWSAVVGPGCTACPDRDGDGSGARWCGGTDCDDLDPTRAATLPEHCDNRVDDDCDGAIDLLDTACHPANLSCPGAALTVGEPTHGTTITDAAMSPPSGSCGASAFYTLTLATTSDVEVTVRLDTPPPPTPPCPDCPPPSGPMQINYRAFLEPVCGERGGDLFSSAVGSCNYWDPGGSFFSGLQESTYARRRVPAGTYTLEVQAGPLFGFMSSATGFTVTATVTPSADAICDGAALSTTASVRGDTTGGRDAFGTACDGTVRASVERVHPFSLSERSRVRLVATPDETAPGSAPPVRLAILSGCDAGASRTACTESRGSSCQASARLEQILEPGDYEALVEAREGGTASYGLAWSLEPVDAACAGAPTITASGMTSGTTRGLRDAFGDDGVCGSGAGPDAVYRLEVAARSRVVLDVIASFMRPLLRVYTGCGASRVGASRDTPRLDLVLEPGSYDVVIGGERAEDAGSFVLSTTLLSL